MKLIKLYVLGGVAELDESTIPDGYAVQYIDYDNVEDDGRVTVWHVTATGSSRAGHVTLSRD